MKKITIIERAGDTYTVSSPGYYFDECGQIITKKNGILFFGCPNCGASFAETCFCNFISTIDPNNEDDYDAMCQSAYDWNAEHNPSANW